MATVQPALTAQQLGAYLVDAGIVLGFFHGEGFQEASLLATEVGTALEIGSGSFGPIAFPDPQQDGQYIVEAGIVLSFFPGGFKQAGKFLQQLGAAIALNQGTFGPIRAGNLGVSGTILNNTLTGTIGPWT